MSRACHTDIASHPPIYKLRISTFHRIKHLVEGAVHISYTGDGSCQLVWMISHIMKIMLMSALYFRTGGSQICRMLHLAQIMRYQPLNMQDKMQPLLSRRDLFREHTRNKIQIMRIPIGHHHPLGSSVMKWISKPSSCHLTIFRIKVKILTWIPILTIQLNLVWLILLSQRVFR